MNSDWWGSDWWGYYNNTTSIISGSTTAGYTAQLYVDYGSPSSEKLSRLYWLPPLKRGKPKDPGQAALATINKTMELAARLLEVAGI